MPFWRPLKWEFCCFTRHFQLLTLHRGSSLSKRKRNRLDQFRKWFFLQLQVQGKYLSMWDLSVGLKALGWSIFLSLCEHYFPRHCHHLLGISTSIAACHVCLPRPPSPLPPWLHLCEHNLELHLSVLLPGLAALSVGGRVPLRGRRTDVAYIMICKSVISAALIPLASLRTSPYGWLVLLCQAFLFHAKPEKPKARRYFPPLVRVSESMGSAGTAFTAPLEGNYQHLSARGQSGHRMIA